MLSYISKRKRAIFIPAMVKLIAEIEDRRIERKKRFELLKLGFEPRISSCRNEDCRVEEDDLAISSVQIRTGIMCSRRQGRTRLRRKGRGTLSSLVLGWRVYHCTTRAFWSSDVILISI